MLKILTAIAAVSMTSAVVHAQELNIMSWGGAYTKSQVEAYHTPYIAQTGIKINSMDAGNPAAPIKAQVKAGNVSIDVATVLATDAARLCDEGLLEKLDLKDLPAGADGTAAASDFIRGALTECSVASDVYSYVIAYDESKLKGVSSAADFFDLEKFPGKRALPKNAQGSLEIALVADGVSASNVYKVLATPDGLAQALRKLDTIKSQTVWWEAGAQAPQLLADGEATMAVAFNGRIFAAAVQDNKPFKVLWDGQVLDLDVFVIPKGAPNKKEAWDYIKFATRTQPNADQTKWISYGPTRKSALPLVTTFSDGKTEMANHLPSARAHIKNAVMADPAFWVDHGDDLNERFNAWLSSN